MSRLRLVDQSGGVLCDRDLVPGWNYLFGPVGAWFWPSRDDEPDTLRLSAGVYNGEGEAGVVYLRGVEWKGREYAKGDECLYRAPLILRDWLKSYLEPARPVVLGGVSFQMPYEVHKPRRETLGMWTVEGDTGPDWGGLHRVAPIPSIPEALSLSHAGTMARMALDCLDRETGLPMAPHAIVRDGYYATTRYWGKVSTLPRFVESAGDDRRKPRKWNAGSCGYEERLLGYGSGLYNGFQPFDGQHLGRALGPVQALAEGYGDPCAALDWRVLASDCVYAHPVWSAPTKPHNGSAFLGGREAAWCVLAMRGLHDPRLLARAGEALAGAQMPNGGVQRMSYGSWQPSPDCWVKSVSVPTPLPVSTDAEQSMERFLTTAAFAATGRWREAHATVDSLFAYGGLRSAFGALVTKYGYVPKFLGVAHRGSAPFRRVTVGAGGPDFAPWIPLGLMMHHWHHEGWSAGKYLRWILRIHTPTQGKGLTLRDLRRRLELESRAAGQWQTGTVLSALISELES